MDKVILFIVEGATDKKALENIFKKIYRNKAIHFEFTSGDVSSDKNVNLSNVETKVYEYVDRYRKDKKLSKKDISQVVHIFDMDGAYIDDSYIKKSDDDGFIYSEEGIECSDVNRVIIRNSHKREIMDYLLSRVTIKGIPYRCFYFSCNLDHALYNKPNLNENEKMKYANAFYESFIGKEELFVKFLDYEVVNNVPITYDASWSFIKSELHSLERHTNLNVYFRENPLF